MTSNDKYIILHGDIEINTSNNLYKYPQKERITINGLTLKFGLFCAKTKDKMLSTLNDFLNFIKK